MGWNFHGSRQNGFPWGNFFCGCLHPDNADSTSRVDFRAKKSRIRLICEIHENFTSRKIPAVRYIILCVQYYTIALFVSMYIDVHWCKLCGLYNISFSMIWNEWHQHYDCCISQALILFLYIIYMYIIIMYINNNYIFPSPSLSSFLPFHLQGWTLNVISFTPHLPIMIEVLAWLIYSSIIIIEPIDGWKCKNNWGKAPGLFCGWTAVTRC